MAPLLCDRLLSSRTVVTQVFVPRSPERRAAAQQELGKQQIAHWDDAYGQRANGSLRAGQVSVLCFEQVTRGKRASANKERT